MGRFLFEAKRLPMFDVVATGIIRSKVAIWPVSRSFLEQMQQRQGHWCAKTLCLRQQELETGREFGARRANICKNLSSSSWPLTTAKTGVLAFPHAEASRLLGLQSV